MEIKRDVQPKRRDFPASFFTLWARHTLSVGRRKVGSVLASLPLLPGADSGGYPVAGYPGTRSADCGLVASKFWLEAGQKRGVPVTALPSEWLQKHLLQVAVGLISRSVMTLLPPVLSRLPSMPVS